jgi:hypothetical protein
MYHRTVHGEEGLTTQRDRDLKKRKLCEMYALNYTELAYWWRDSGVVDYVAQLLAEARIQSLYFLLYHFITSESI